MNEALFLTIVIVLFLLITIMYLVIFRNRSRLLMWITIPIYLIFWYLYFTLALIAGDFLRKKHWSNMDFGHANEDWIVASLLGLLFTICGIIFLIIANYKYRKKTKK
jgi:membrane protein insertase Oxa1/YidC/SpoIIIJ